MEQDEQLAPSLGEDWEEEPGPATEPEQPSQPSAPGPEAEALGGFAPHFRELERQGAALERLIPGFDLKKELRNPVFARLTAPGSGLGVEDAFFAVHRRELQAAAMERSAQRTAQKLARSIQAGQLRPRENGAEQSAAVTGFDYRHATREQREALKRQIREASARGEKVFPY